MSKNLKVLLVVLAVIVLGIAAYLGYSFYAGKSVGGPAVFKEEAAPLPSGTSTTDDSLNKDTAAIDAQLKGLDADSASADATLKESAQVQ